MFGLSQRQWRRLKSWKLIGRFTLGRRKTLTEPSCKRMQGKYASYAERSRKRPKDNTPNLGVWKGQVSCGKGWLFPFLSYT